MGHERIGYLPKTKKWATVVSEVTNYTSNDNTQIVNISKQTLKNVRYKFKNIISDSGVNSAFEYLVLLTLIPKTNNWKKFLLNKGIILGNNFNLLEVVANGKKYIEKNESSKEYSAFAIQSLSDSISLWANKTKQGNLFTSHNSQKEIWKTASTGSGFCELSRIFFSKFTERYLKYFLEREAFGKIRNLSTLNVFTSDLRNHIDSISIHAFEISKITQSFSAGWYNKNIKATLPSQENIRSFVDYSFKKINSELLVEEND
jgi:hypothetical protein